MGLLILRCTFVLVVAGLGAIVNAQLARMWPQGRSPWEPWSVFVGLMALAAGVIAIDVLIPRKRLQIISTVYFGLIVGLFLTFVLRLALGPFLPDEEEPLARIVHTGLAVAFCYICISFLMQTQDDFRFIIPYVEFAKEVKGIKPFVLDTSVVIDGRIADVIETGILDNQLIMPRFVLGELQGIADSSDRLRRGRGRRGLDVLNKLKSNDRVDFQIYDQNLPEFDGQPVDLRLVLLAKHLDGKVVTNDYNLNKVAKVHGVEVINLNDIANSLKPVHLPGEIILVRVVKAGEEPGQGVGYLDDGTMIVVENGRDQIGKDVRINITSMLQTSAGRMIFGRFEDLA